MKIIRLATLILITTIFGLNWCSASDFVLDTSKVLDSSAENYKQKNNELLYALLNNTGIFAEVSKLNLVILYFRNLIIICTLSDESSASGLMPTITFKTSISGTYQEKLRTSINCSKQ